MLKIEEHCIKSKLAQEGSNERNTEKAAEETITNGSEQVFTINTANDEKNLQRLREEFTKDGSEEYKMRLLDEFYEYLTLEGRRFSKLANENQNFAIRTIAEEVNKLNPEDNFKKFVRGMAFLFEINQSSIGYLISTDKPEDSIVASLRLKIISFLKSYNPHPNEWKEFVELFVLIVGDRKFKTINPFSRFKYAGYNEGTYLDEIPLEKGLEYIKKQMSKILDKNIG